MILVLLIIVFFCFSASVFYVWTHLCWFRGVDLGHWSLFLFKVLRSIPPLNNLVGLVLILKKSYFCLNLVSADSKPVAFNPRVNLFGHETIVTCIEVEAIVTFLEFVRTESKQKDLHWQIYKKKNIIVEGNKIIFNLQSLVYNCRTSSTNTTDKKKRKADLAEELNLEVSNKKT